MLRKKGGRAERECVCGGNTKHERERGRACVQGMANHNCTQESLAFAPFHTLAMLCILKLRSATSPEGPNPQGSGLAIWNSPPSLKLAPVVSRYGDQSRSINCRAVPNISSVTDDVQTRF
jgi:hypothetical protein